MVLCLAQESRPQCRCSLDTLSLLRIAPANNTCRSLFFGRNLGRKTPSRSHGRHLCWSKTYGTYNASQDIVFDLVGKRCDIELLTKRLWPIWFLETVEESKWYCICSILAFVSAVNPINTFLDIFSPPPALTSEKYETHPKLFSIGMSAPKPITGKRRRASDGEVIATSQTRRRAIEETTKREHSKRKSADDLDDPIGDFFSKKRRIWSFQPADIQWTHGRKKSFYRKRSPYLYQWLPRRPPWYTSRVYKSFDMAGRPRRRRVDCSKEQVQGMENWLSKYDPHFNAFCADELSTSLSSLSLADGGTPTSRFPPAPFVPAADSAYQPRVKEVDEGEEEEL